MPSTETCLNFQIGLHCWVGSRIGAEKQFAELTNVAAAGSAVTSPDEIVDFLSKPAPAVLWFWFQFLRQWDEKLFAQDIFHHIDLNGVKN